MDFSKIEYFISLPRISRYLQATNGDKDLAAELYLDNLELAKAFHPLIGVFEVALRNALNNKITAHLGDSDWIISEKRGFMIDPSLRYVRAGRHTVNDYLLRSVQGVETEIRRNRGQVTSAKIISDLMFGFWTSLFENYHYRLLSGTPIQIFNGLPSGTSRSSIANHLKEIRAYRNRMNHNESLCLNRQRFDCSRAKSVHNTIYQLLKWMDGDLAAWTLTVDTVSNQIKIMEEKYN